MAKLNGIEVKAVKGFTGHEGYCYQGNVYKDGKKLGFWSQDGWGGPDDFGFDESLLDDACRKFKDGFPDDYQYKDFADSKDVFMHHLVELRNIEKDCKKAFKDGFKAVIYLTDGFHYTWMAVADEEDDETLKGKYSQQLEKMRAQMFKNGHTEMVIRPGEFDIIVDNDHPAPNLFML